MDSKTTVTAAGTVLALAAVASSGVYLAKSDFRSEIDAGFNEIPQQKQVFTEYVSVNSSDEKSYTCGTVQDLARWQLIATPKTDQEIYCKKTYVKSARCAMCGDELCRYGLARGGVACDPDGAKCVPWPCEVIAGQDPAEIAAQPIVRTKHIFDNEISDFEPIEIGR